MDSRFFRFVVRVLHLFPAVVLVLALAVCAVGLRVLQLINQSADQFLTVQSAGLFR